MVDRSIVAAVRKYLRALNENGLAVSFGVVFGSWARGNADKWSDIDLLVVSPRFDGGVQRSDIDLLWRSAARNDSRIEPFPCGRTQWDEDDSVAVVEIARREGQRITVDEETEASRT